MGNRPEATPQETLEFPRSNLSQAIAALMKLESIGTGAIFASTLRTPRRRQKRNRDDSGSDERGREPPDSVLQSVPEASSRERPLPLFETGMIQEILCRVGRSFLMDPAFACLTQAAKTSAPSRILKTMIHQPEKFTMEHAL